MLKENSEFFQSSISYYYLNLVYLIYLIYLVYLVYLNMVINNVII